MKEKKETKKSIDQKIDDLALITAKGFSEVHKKLSELDLKIENSKEELKKEFNNVFENHVKIIRIDYDDLSGRVRQLEMARR